MTVYLRSESASHSSNPTVSRSKRCSPRPKIKVLDNAALVAAYERVDIIAGHTECTVFEVLKRKQPALSRRALKLNLVEPPLDVLAKLQQLKLAQVISAMCIGKIQVKPKPFVSELNSSFVQEPRKKSKNGQWAYLTEMELMEGNLKELKQTKKLSPLEEAVIEVQRIAVEAFLYKKGITISDVKDINVLWQTLPDNDPKRRCNYWMYRIGSEEYYLPPIKYWIKLCDFDHWEYSKKVPSRNFDKEVESRLRNAPRMLLEQIAQFKVRPKKNAKVLKF